MNLLAHFNLRERPFEATWDPRFFYQSHDHDEALSRLGFLVEEKTMNLGMLTGEIGCGKTLTRGVFTRRIAPDRFVVVTQENSAFNFSDLLGGVLETLDPAGKGNSKYARYQRLRKAADQLYEQGKHLILIFDEAQEMSPGTLGELKLLTNLNGAGRAQLTLILLGQPELRGMVARLPAIDQRISLRYHLGPLSPSDAQGFVQHRLRVAGHQTGDLFSVDAIARLYDSSKGIPRELNRLAKLALEYTWLRELPRVEESCVEMVVRDLSHHQNLCAA